VGETHGRRPPLFPPTLKRSNTQIRMVQPLAGLGAFSTCTVGETHGRRPPLFPPTLKRSNTQIRMVQPLAGLGAFSTCTVGFTHGYSHWTPVGVPGLWLAMVISPFPIKDNLMIAGFVLDKSGHYYLSPAASRRVMMGLRLFAAVGGRSFPFCCREPRGRCRGVARRVCDCRASFRAPSGSAASRWPPAPFGWRASG